MSTLKYRHRLAGLAALAVQVSLGITQRASADIVVPNVFPSGTVTTQFADVSIPALSPSHAVSAAIVKQGDLCLIIPLQQAVQLQPFGPVGVADDVVYVGGPGSDYVTFAQGGWKSRNDCFFVATPETFPTFTPLFLSSMSVRALTQNGFWIDVSAQGGNDLLNSPLTGSVGLYGDAGSDALLSMSPSGTLITGGPGNDTIDAFAFESLLVGDDGDDLFCLHPSALWVEGGNGTDTMCGTATNFFTLEKFRAANCGACAAVN